ncbi:MAG: bifunctional phosphopantothenoylcysteine decarboxylase/phosphopantothenate--cysteine ligase CoaBC [Lachnospiraceae bacterium]|nr:bifunctional phosphopantothenoylcysteine decarboxylase/phosphopantothenate--cysteine ligase CoaBC [Lachnospiraceae bacterium]
MKDKKTVLLCITGGIAAYKMANVASGLAQRGFDVHVIMTEHAAEFITPLTMETLTHNRCYTKMFDGVFDREVRHIALAKAADLILISPATANVIAKLAHGIADDMLTTTVLAARCEKLIAPAMNTAMLHNPVTQDNIETLKRYGYTIIRPATGHLACGDSGEGKMPEPAELIDHVEQHLAFEKDLAGKKILVTAGPTQEAMDPVRYITNHSSGKMGYAIAKIAARRGADVTLVTGPVALEPLRFVHTIPVVSAADMMTVVSDAAPRMDIIIKAAAVADYRPQYAADQKMKKTDEELFISLERTTDILAYLGAHRREGQFLCGFSMETQDMLENSRKKLESKNLDMICANNVKEEGAGFAVDTNVLTLITKDTERALPCMSKEEAASEILSEILKRIG